MKIMIHCGSGNTDRPNRWLAIYEIFSDLAETLSGLGHDLQIMVHPEAFSGRRLASNISVRICSQVDLDYVKAINPDVGITWNGNSLGDIAFISAIGKDKAIFAELGYFGHYDKTCYFDRCGVNARHSLIGHDYENDLLNPENLELVLRLQTMYRKPQIFNDPFIFVPLQDESDTQICQYSPFKTMDDFLSHVLDVFRFSDYKILYKPHPRALTKISIKHTKLIQVSDDVHHFLPYAKFVCGINSTVMIESLLYHSRIISYGAGITSRHFGSDAGRLAFIANLYKRQLLWSDLKSKAIVESSHLYRILEEI